MKRDYDICRTVIDSADVEREFHLCLDCRRELEDDYRVVEESNTHRCDRCHVKNETGVVV